MTNSAVNPSTLNNGTTVRGSDIFQIYLVDEDGQSILSIDDGAKRQSLRVEIVNTSGQTIALKDLEGNLSTNYHFRIAFRPGTLVDQGKGVTLTVQDGQGQKIEGSQIEQANDSFFLRLDKSAVAKAIAPGQRLTLVLGNIGAAPAGGSRGTRVEIQLTQLRYENTSQEINETRLQYLNIVNQRGKKQIPLYAGFLGSNTILNDGSENELTLSIQSLPRQNLSLIIEPYSSDRFTNPQSIASDQTSFGKTVLELLQEQSQFKTFFIDIANRAIDEGMQPGIVFNKLVSSFGSQPPLVSASITTFIATLGTITSAVTTEVTRGFKQSIGDLINKNLSNKLLDGQRSIQSLIEAPGDIQKSFVDAIFTSSSKTKELFDRIKSFLSGINVGNTNLDSVSFLKLILPDSMANLKLFDKLKNENNPAKKQELASALITSVTNTSLISQDDLKIILARLGQLNFTPAATVLQNLNIIRLDNAEPVEKSVLGLSGINSDGMLDRSTANDALDESVKITISFDVATTTDDSRHWALVEKTNADDIQIAIAQGQETWVFGGKFEQGVTPQWSFVCKQPLQLTDRQEILRLSIKNLKTQLLSGYANLYVHYENFPGYWDGFITVPIHKGPLVYREFPNSASKENDQAKAKVGCVGIGTDKPQAKLHVKSSTDVVGLRVEGDAEITGDFSAGKLSMGELGIGITDLGGNKLKVQGNTAISGNLSINNGKVGIGIAPGTEQLKVQGDAAIAGKLTVTSDLSVGQMIGGNATQTEYGTKLYFRGAKENTDSIWMSRFNAGNDNSHLRICLGDESGSGDQLEVGYVDYSNNQWVQKFSVGTNGNVTITGSVSTGGKIRIKNTDKNKYLVLGRSDGPESSADATSNAEFRLEMVCSRTLKENISSLSSDEAIQTLSALRSVKYDYKREKAFRQILGFIAEEMPDNLASHDHQSISPFEVIPILTKVIQLQQESIRQLQEKVDMIWPQTDEQQEDS